MMGIYVQSECYSSDFWCRVMDLFSIFLGSDMRSFHSCVYAFLSTAREEKVCSELNIEN